MVECPVCGAASPPDQPTCAVCGLPTEFADAFREPGNPAVDPTPAPTAGEPADSAEADQPWWSRPGPQSSMPAASDLQSLGGRPSPENRPSPVKADSSLPDSAGPAAEVDRIGRSLGMDLSEAATDLGDARADGNPPSLSRPSRERIRSVLDELLRRYRTLCDRRNALSRVVRTHALDEELIGYRKALGEGALGRADEHRLKAERTVESLESSWSRIKGQFSEAGQMMRALREMGGVAPTVLRPVVDAVRIPRRGDAGQIELRLKKANELLWGLLVPRMDYEISRGRTLLDAAKASAARTNLIRREIDRMAEEIRSQKISEALESRRFLRAELASVAPKAPRTSVRRSFIE